MFISLAHDHAFINYIELLEQYFPFGLPVKIFDEEPKRLRIYGSLSTYEEAAFTQVINKISEEHALIVDMTNFSGMGTLLYECFKPLNKSVSLASSQANKLKCSSEL